MYHLFTCVYRLEKEMGEEREKEKGRVREKRREVRYSGKEKVTKMWTKINVPELWAMNSAQLPSERNFLLHVLHLFLPYALE